MWLLTSDLQKVASLIPEFKTFLFSINTETDDLQRDDSDVNRLDFQSDKTDLKIFGSIVYIPKIID